MKTRVKPKKNLDLSAKKGLCLRKRAPQSTVWHRTTVECLQNDINAFFQCDELSSFKNAYQCGPRELFIMQVDTFSLPPPLSHHFPVCYGNNDTTCDQSASETHLALAYAKRRESSVPKHQQKQRQRSRVKSESYTTTSSRSIDEIVLDLLRGKIGHCHRSLQQKRHEQQRAYGLDNRQYGEIYRSIGNVATHLLSPFDDDTSATHSVCDCKVMIVVDYSHTSVTAPNQHWVVQLKAAAFNSSAKSTYLAAVADISNQNYLSCLESIQLYRNEHAVLAEEPSHIFSNRAWFLLENLLRHAVRSGADVLLKEFVDCPDCR